MDSFNISGADIRQLPLLTFKGNIIVIEDEKSMRESVEILNTLDVMGFDTEKKPTFHKGEYHPTAMVQLSSYQEAFLFRLNKIGYSKPLFDLLANPDKIKLGISIGDDIKALKKLYPFQPSGFSDLNDVIKKMGIKHKGVKKLAAIFLDSQISKRQQTSNWEKDILTEAQKKYADTDAWICLAIYEKLRSRGLI